MRRAVLAVVAVVMGTLVSAAPPAVAKVTVGGSLKASSSQVVAGTSFTLAGRLSTRFQRPVRLQRKTGSVWAVMQTKRSNRSGAVSFAQTSPLAAGSYGYRLYAPRIRVQGKWKPATRTPVATVAVRSVSPTPVPTPTVTSTPTPIPTATPTPTPQPTPVLGSRENPISTGTGFTSGAWGFSLGVTDLDAWPEIEAENMFNEPPPVGWSYITVPVTVSYRGTGSETPWIENYIEFVGSNGVVYTSSSSDAWCGVVPSSYYDVPEMYAGGSATGNVCAVVPTGYIAGGLWRVRGSYSSPAVFVKKA